MKICAKNDFYIFVPGDIDISSSDIKFVPLVFLVQHYVTTKLEVSNRAFLLRESRRRWTDRRTDRRVQFLTRPPMEGHIIIGHFNHIPVPSVCDCPVQFTFRLFITSSKTEITLSVYENCQICFVCGPAA